MKNHRSYPDPSSQGSGEAFAAAADDDGDGKWKSMRAADARKHEKKKDRSPSPVSGCPRMDIDEAVIPGTWTGEKKTKIQWDGDLGRIDEQPDKGVRAVDHEQDWPKEIEEFNWDDDHLRMATDQYVEQLLLHHRPPDYDNMESPDEKQLQELMSRLALYRVRAYKGDDLKGLDIDRLSEYLPHILEDQGHYKWCEREFGWFFDPKSFDYVGLEDYQRLMLRNDNMCEFDDDSWELYGKLRSTIEGDRQYVEFWNKFSSETKWIEKALIAGSDVWEKLERVAYYRAVKIAIDFPNIYSTLIFSGFQEYKWSVHFDKIYVEGYFWLYFELWKRIAKQKIDFKEALEQLSAEDMPFSSSIHMKAELSKGRAYGMPGSVTCDYKTFIAGIDGELEEVDARPFIMEAAIKIARKPKMYYDYAKEKLKIAEEIGVIIHQTKQKVLVIQHTSLSGST